MSDTGDWDCDAYGPDGRGLGALCFLADPGVRVCLSPALCRVVMDAERRRVFRRISEFAARGDPVFAELEAAFPDPGKLLGGGDDGTEEKDDFHGRGLSRLEDSG